MYYDYYDYFDCYDEDDFGKELYLFDEVLENRPDLEKEIKYLEMKYFERDKDKLMYKEVMEAFENDKEMNVEKLEKIILKYKNDEWI